MASNSIQPGKKTIGINMKIELAELLETRAASMHLSTGKYCKIIMAQWLESGELLHLEEK